MRIEDFKNPGNEYRVDIRWWLAEGFHTDETLKKELCCIEESGFGAIEFLATEETGADSEIYGWGSEEWVHDSHIIFEEATKKGLGVSATCGTNWSNCNLNTITPDERAASKELDYSLEILSPGQTRNGLIREAELHVENVTKQELVAVVAVRDLGEKNGKKYLDKNSAVVLTSQVRNGTLNWTAPEDGSYDLFTFWIHGTGQTAAPSAGMSYTVNYMDRYGIEAFKEYWDNEVLTNDLRKIIRNNPRPMMYMDSLELCTFGRGGQLWGYHFIDEFRIRRGYDLTPYLPFIVRNAGIMQDVIEYSYYMEDKNFAEKLYNDFYQTATDLYMENMLKPMQEWCHIHGMQLRSEISYGLPFEISQPGKYVDGIETESFEFASQIESYRNLAGPAHIYNKIFSSETGANRMNYMNGLDFYNQIIFTQFAAGVTRTVLHGYSSIAGSEQSTYWPGHEGMWPIFSERFGMRQPSYPYYKEWITALSRYQMILQKGVPRMDLGILRTDYNFNNLLFKSKNGEAYFYERELMRGHEGLYWKDMNLQDNGYTWDYFSPQILEEEFVDCAEGVLLPEGPGYQAVIVYQEAMPVKAAEKLLALSDKGLPVIFVNGASETVRPGVTVRHDTAACKTPFNDEMDTTLAGIIARIKANPMSAEVEDQSRTMEALQKLGVYPRAAFEKPNKNILTLIRKENEIIYFYAYNKQYCENDSCTFTVKISGVGKPYRLDCWNARITEEGSYQLTNSETVLTLTLKPGETCLYAVDTSAEKEVHAVSASQKVVVEHGKLTAFIEKRGSYSFSLSDGTTYSAQVNVPDAIEINNWDLLVEDWNEGKKNVITEDRGLGITTREVYYETAKNKIHVGDTELISWKNIDALGPDVSGVGYYKACVELRKEDLDNGGAVLKIDNLNHGTASIYVNGVQPGTLDPNGRELDISEVLKEGRNEILVRIATTLKNRLIERAYYEKSGLISSKLMKLANNASDSWDRQNKMKEKKPENPARSDSASQLQPADYGMTGKVILQFYKKVIMN